MGGAGRRRGGAARASRRRRGRRRRRAGRGRTGEAGRVRRLARCRRAGSAGERARAAPGRHAAVAPAAAPHRRGGGAATHGHRQAPALRAARVGGADLVTSHTTELRVRWGDVDWAGIVFYPRFYEWFDLACDALFESLGLPWPALFPRHGIVGVPIVESGARFVSPVRLGDLVRIRCTAAWG